MLKGKHLKGWMMPFFFLLVSACACSCAGREYPLRMMTYNIRNAIGMDGKADAGRIAQVIRNASPDVVAIQEVDSVTERSGGRDLLAEIGRQTGMRHYFAAAIRFQGGKYGIGILSKEQPKSLCQVALPGAEEARTMLVAEFERYRFACVHLSLTPQDRAASLQMIGRMVSDGGKPFFLAGDWNIEASDPQLSAASRDFLILNDVDECTYPAVSPDSCLDYIAVGRRFGGAVRLKEACKSLVCPESRASDHRPVVVEVVW